MFHDPHFIERYLPRRGYLRERDLVGPDGFFPFSKSTLWSMVSDGSFPAPVKLGRRITAWCVEDIAVYLTHVHGGE